MHKTAVRTRKICIFASQEKCIVKDLIFYFFLNIGQEYFYFIIESLGYSFGIKIYFPYSLQLVRSNFKNYRIIDIKKIMVLVNLDDMIYLLSSYDINQYLNYLANQLQCYLNFKFQLPKLSSVKVPFPGHHFSQTELEIILKFMRIFFSHLSVLCSEGSNFDQGCMLVYENYKVVGAKQSTPKSRDHFQNTPL